LKNNAKILVMGGLGFIGSHLCRFLLAEGHFVRIFDKLYGSRKLISGIQDKVEIFEGDAEKPEDVLSALENIEIAIHLIHTTVPGSSMQNPAYDIESNVTANSKWLSRLGETGLKRIIYISSGGTVYGQPKANLINEAHPTDPLCSYGITKLMLEKYISMYSKLSGIEYRICRPSNVYGEGQHLNIGQGVIGVFLDRCRKGLPLKIWGDGSIRRDYLYVGDLIRGIGELIHHQGKSRVFNISSGAGYSLNDIIEIIRNEFHIVAEVEYSGARSIDVPINILDNSLIRNETGWKPEIDFIRGIRSVNTWLSKVN